jgi:hypothetical protein
MILSQLLESSRASEPFRAAVATFRRTGRSCDRIVFDYRCPAVKVERTLTKALEEYPELPIESIEIQAQSGCEYFRGTLTMRAGDDERTVRFHWDCKWRAEQQGWSDYFGFADQGRAAREFGHDCFRTWEEAPVLETAG